jgi:hypothetical protein
MGYSRDFEKSAANLILPKFGVIVDDGFTEGFRRLPALDNAAHRRLSNPRQPGILVKVHSVPPKFAKLKQLRHPWSGPNGQPIETLCLRPGETSKLADGRESG